MGVALNLGQEPIWKLHGALYYVKENSFNVFFHDNPPTING